MSVFLGIGLGPIQTGIFLSGAWRGGVKRLVVAEVEAALVEQVREADGRISINIAHENNVTSETISGVEIYNPLDPKDKEILISIAADASEIATALPSVKVFPTALSFSTVPFTCTARPATMLLSHRWTKVA